MSRYSRITVIQRQIESAYGVAPGSWSSAHSAPIYADPVITPEPQTVENDIIRDFLGATESLPGWEAVRVTYELMMAGSGTAGTAPAWGVDMRLCGFAETVTAGSHVAYTPVSASFSSATIRTCMAGVIRRAVGCRGTATIRLMAGEAPKLGVDALGVRVVVSEAATPNIDENQWRRPFVINENNGGFIRFGCSYASGSGAITGGTAYPNRGMEITVGHDLRHLQILPADEADIVHRAVSVKMTLFPTAAQEVEIEGWRSNGTLQSLGFQVGPAAGDRIGVFMPRVQITRAQSGEYEGRRTLEIEAKAVALAPGNNELVVVAR